jgi:hypothetical protein
LAAAEMPAAAELELTLSVRRTYSGGGHTSGTPRLWYNDSQANSGFGATIEDTSSVFFLWEDFRLSTSTGRAKEFIDGPVNNKAKSPDRPFKAFGTWSVMLP